MSTLDINLQNIARIAQDIQALHWKWQKAEWPSIASQLNLDLVETVLSRESYSFLSKTYPRDVSIHFSDSELDCVVIDLAVFIDTESLDPYEYDAKIDEFEHYYQDCLESLEVHLGPCSLTSESELDDHNAIEGVSWKLQNASAYLLLLSQGSDVPILLSIQIEPSIA
jgi:hypothetical protein